MTLRFFDQQDVLRQIAEEEIGEALPEKARFFGLSNDTGLGILGIGEYNGHNGVLYVACVGKNPPMRKAWQLAQRWAFDVCGLTRITSKVDAANTKACRMNRLFGLKEEGRIRKAIPDSGNDLIIFGLLAEERTDNGARHGKQIRRTA